MTNTSRKLLARVHTEQGGASLVEYALLLAFIAIAAFAAIAFFGNSLGSDYSDIASSMP